MGVDANVYPKLKVATPCRHTGGSQADDQFMAIENEEIVYGKIALPWVFMWFEQLRGFWEKPATAHKSSNQTEREMYWSDAGINAQASFYLPFNSDVRQARREVRSADVHTRQAIVLYTRMLLRRTFPWCTTYLIKHHNVRLYLYCWAALVGHIGFVSGGLLIFSILYFLRLGL